MPQKIFCTKCNGILYQGLEVKSPYVIFDRHGGKCPYCHEKLEIDLKKIGVIEFEGNLQEYRKTIEAASSEKKEAEPGKSLTTIEKLERRVTRIILKRQEYRDKS